MEFNQSNQSNRMQDLIAGYALDILNEEEYAEAQHLLRTNQQARLMLLELREVSGLLAMSVEPVDLPEGSLNRLRQKAEREAAPNKPASINYPNSAPNVSGRSVPPKTFNFFKSSWLLAASIVFFFSSAVLLVLWLIANNNLSENERNSRELLALLSAPNLKVTALEATTGQSSGNLRLYVNPADNKAYLVVQGLASLPSDKEYEAWFISSDAQLYKAGLLGSGGVGKLAVYELEISKAIGQYTAVAITVEPKGGVNQPTQAPIFRGNIG